MRQFLKFGTFLKFGLVGTIGFLVDAGTLLALVHAGAKPLWGRIGSFVAAASITFVLNHRFTFGIAGHPNASRWSYYVLLTAFGGGINLGIYRLWIGQFGSDNTHLIIGTAIGSLAALSMNYTLSRLLVFDSDPNSQVSRTTDSSI